MTIIKYALAGIVLLSGVNSFAQENSKSLSAQTEQKKPKTTAEKADKKIAKLTEELSLTEAQVVEIKPLIVTFIENMQEVKADESISAEDNKAKALKESFRTDLESKLDDAQTEKLAALQAEREAKIAEKKANKKTPGEHAAEQTDEMTELLSLTPEQVEQVRVLNLKVANKISAIKKDDSMSPEKKKEFIQGNKKDHKFVMGTILTDEQMVTYEAYLAEKKELRKEKKADKVQKVKATE